MNSVLKNVLAAIAGVAVGMIVNMGTIILGTPLIPPPEGVDVMNEESLRAGVHLFSAKHFIVPFLAHALGTLAGAFVATKIAVTHKKYVGWSIGVFFLIAGITAATMVPAPKAFIAFDLIAAYIPMGWLGWKLALRKG